MVRKHHCHEIKNFEFYEYAKVEKQQQRQSSKKSSKSKRLLMPVDKRSQLLLKSGYSLHAIANATLKADTIKQERFETLRKSGWNNFVHKSGTLPAGLLRAALGTTNDLFSSGAGMLNKQLSKAFGGNGGGSSNGATKSKSQTANREPKTLPARSA